MIQEFKDFINKGNVIDLAVAVVMGAAFAPVIGAIVDRILMPLIAMIFGQPNFDSIGTFGENGSIGAVITAIVQFLLVALALFFVIRAYNRMKGPEEEADDGPTEVDLLTEIRDQLAHRP